ncbi:MAG: metallophosphoesterase [Patescibacteria group bacterium]
MKPIDILIVSDIHLGSSVCRSRELLRTLKGLVFRTLILNGDIFDDLNLTRLSEHDWKLFGHLRDLSAPGSGTEVVWIAGNHDVSARMLQRIVGFAVKGEYLFEWQGTRCLVIHGHQFDRFLNKNIIISTIASTMYLVIQHFDSKDQRVSRWVKRMSKAWLRLSTKVANGATWYGKHLKRADVVFCGHTHLELHGTFNGLDYWNSNCWTDIPSSYITIDSEAGIKLHRVG